MSLTVKEYLYKASKDLDSIAGDLAPLEARLLLCHILDCDRAFLIGHPDHLLSEQQAQAYDDLVARRLLGEPIAKIVGYKEFWGLKFHVTKDTLDPRPDSETLIEGLLERVDASHVNRVLDLGSGTGCLMLSLLYEWPLARGVGVDISIDAIRIAEGNAFNLSLDHRVEFMHSDWGERVHGVFDVIVSNPPYISDVDYLSLSRSVRDFDPKLALVAGEDGLDAYRKIAPVIYKHLASQGLFAIEFGVDQENPVAEILTGNNLEPLEFRKDLAGIIRCIIGRRR